VFYVPGWPTTDLFQNLTAKANSKLDSWKAKCFFKAGLVVLIQSNLEVLPSYTMHCYKLASLVTDKLDWMIFFKNSTSDKGLPLISQDKIAVLKSLQGWVSEKLWSKHSFSLQIGVKNASQVREFLGTANSSEIWLSE